MARASPAIYMLARSLRRRTVRAIRSGIALFTGAPPIGWQRIVTLPDAQMAFRLILGRELDKPAFADELARAGVTVADLVKQLIASDEFAIRRGQIPGVAATGGSIPDIEYRNPSLARAPAVERRVLLVGSCLMEPWPAIIAGVAPEMTVSHALFNNASDLPALTADEAAAFDYQIVQLPVRSLIPEGMIYSLAADDAAGFERAFDTACQLIDHNLDAALAHNHTHGMLTFLMNLVTPQQNLMGRFADRYSLGNPVHFVEELNRYMAAKASAHPNVHLVDFENIVSTLGKRYFQDDSVMHANHGSFLHGIAAWKDGERLEAIGDPLTLYGPKTPAVVGATVREIDGMYRSLSGTDAIKIVIFDLDDTLWRGIAAEETDIGPHMSEGWPLGIVEAASYLWRRGILVAIVSKNDEAVATGIWNTLYGHIFGIDHFVIRKINWRPKAANIAEILAAVNLLPESALLVDDNPVERAAVTAAIPGLRVLDSSLAEWRRALLWAPETQAIPTAEAAARTPMVQAQLRRETQRGVLDHDAFLASLDLKVSTVIVRDLAHNAFDRCLELLNKTNQFNTTGRRWTPAELGALLAAGGWLIALSATDRFTAYGIVSVCVVAGDVIEQMVLSCRVFGMQVERAAIDAAVAEIHARGHAAAAGRIVRTDRNRLSLDVFAANGFVPAGDEGLWRQASAEADFQGVGMVSVA